MCNSREPCRKTWQHPSRSLCSPGITSARLAAEKQVKQSYSKAMPANATTAWHPRTSGVPLRVRGLRTWSRVTEAARGKHQSAHRKPANDLQSWFSESSCGEGKKEDAARTQLFDSPAWLSSNSMANVCAFRQQQITELLDGGALPSTRIENCERLILRRAQERRCVRDGFWGTGIKPAALLSG